MFSVAHIAMPLVWHILNIKLDPHAQRVKARERLRIYLRALSALKERYEGVDRVLHHIRQIVAEADAHVAIHRPGSRESREPLDKSTPPISDDGGDDENTDDYAGAEADAFTYLPRFFLRTIATVQMSLALGEYPKEHELPPPLASPTASSAPSTCTCISNHVTWDLPELQDFFVGATDIMNWSGLDQAVPTFGYEDCDVDQKPDSPASLIDFDHLIVPSSDD